MASLAIPRYVRGQQQVTSDFVDTAGDFECKVRINRGPPNNLPGDRLHLCDSRMTIMEETQHLLTA